MNEQDKEAFDVCNSKEAFTEYCPQLPKNVYEHYKRIWQSGLEYERDLHRCYWCDDAEKERERSKKLVEALESMQKCVSNNQAWEIAKQAIKEYRGEK